MELITENCMPYIKVPELSEEEKALPYAKYYTDYRLYPPNPIQQQILEAVQSMFDSDFIFNVSFGEYMFQ
mgnify:CR=1 FL=1